MNNDTFLVTEAMVAVAPFLAGKEGTEVAFNDLTVDEAGLVNDYLVALGAAQKVGGDEAQKQPEGATSSTSTPKADEEDASTHILGVWEGKNIIRKNEVEVSGHMYTDVTAENGDTYRVPSEQITF